MTASDIKDRMLVPAVIALVFGAGAGWTRQQLHSQQTDATVAAERENTKQEFADLRADMTTQFTALNAKVDQLDRRQQQFFCLSLPKAYRDGCQSQTLGSPHR